ncbi:hypothetical protein [Umezawaea sp.]|uniref:hypothetical protein n=1 Tax=Umezawaea sp. TaxID=1955258 RepID=UPI002ED1D64A
MNCEISPTRWPDDHVVNVLGFREAVDSVRTVLLPGDVPVKVPSTPALVLLRLFARQDRHHDDTRAALDLRTMTEWYSSEEYLDQLHGEHLAAVRAACRGVHDSDRSRPEQGKRLDPADVSRAG